MSLPAAAPAGTTGFLVSGWPSASRFVLVALSYYALARLGLAFATITANISPVWPPSGLALAALLVGGVRLWPGVACGALAAAFFSGAPPVAAVLMATGNTLEAVVTVVLLRRFFAFGRNFERPRQVVGYILAEGLVGAPLSALCGTLAAWQAGTLEPQRIWQAALTWAGGNFTGAIVIGPLLIAGWPMLSRPPAWARVAELLGALAAVALVGGTVFVWGPGWGFTQPAWLVLPIPFLVWIAWRHAIGGAALAVLVLSAFAVWGTAAGGGPFVGRSAQESFGYLLAYVAVIALTALVLAAFNAQRERLVARLRQREWQLSEAQRIAQLGVWLWNPVQGEFRLSDGGLRVFGLAAPEAPRRLGPFLDRVVVEDRAAFRALLEKARCEEGGQTCDLRIRRPDGQERYLTTTFAASRDGPGAPPIVLGTVLDVTERKRIEDERAAWHRKLIEAQKLESLGLLAGGIAHDFNNLLTGVLGNASLLRLQLPSDSPMCEGLQRIESSAERAADLCRQMLAYSGKGRFLVRPVELNELARGTLALAQNSVPKNAEIVFLPGEPMARVTGDMLQLRQVLLNLVLNAAEALCDAPGRVTVRTGMMAVDCTWLAGAYLSPELPPGEYVFLEVADTGAGIDPEVRDKIFDPFFSTKFIGRGLGLAAVAGIVRSHQGAVRVSSEPGHGSNFRVLLPPIREEAPVHAAAVIDRRDKAGEVWLVVDDEEAVRQVATDLLGSLGISVVVASDGVQALEVFGADGHGVQAVLLDNLMPRLGGLETLKQLRHRRADIPVVLMSGLAAEDALVQFAGLGLAGFLQKPFTLEALRAAVGAVAASRLSARH